MRLKKEWFEKIQKGQKTHEYRRAIPYWNKRIANLCKKGQLYDESIGICFTLGYPKKDDESKKLLAVITKQPAIIDGSDSDLAINAPVWDIEFKLLGGANEKTHIY